MIGDAIPESIDPFDSGHAKMKLKNYRTMDIFSMWTMGLEKTGP